MPNRRGGLSSQTETALAQMRRRIGIANIDDTIRETVLDALKKTGGEYRDSVSPPRSWPDHPLPLHR